MNNNNNNTFNEARKALGEDTINALVAKVSEALKEVKIEGRGNQREQLGFSSKNVSRVMKLARHKKVSTGKGAHNYKIMFPAGFVETLKQEIFKAAMLGYKSEQHKKLIYLILKKGLAA